MNTNINKLKCYKPFNIFLPYVTYFFAINIPLYYSLNKTLNYSKHPCEAFFLA